MEKVLPKGHVSCLSRSFRYTPAVKTNIASTFARISRELGLRAAPGDGRAGAAERPAGVRVFPVETIEAAQRLLRAGASRLAPHLVHSS